MSVSMDSFVKMKLGFWRQGKGCDMDVESSGTLSRLPFIRGMTLSSERGKSE
jgi:hypothetical protein